MPYIFIRVLLSSNLTGVERESFRVLHPTLSFTRYFVKVKTRILNMIQPLPPLPPPSPPPQHIGHRCIITHARTSSCRAIRHAISVWSSSRQCVASENYTVTVRVPFGGFRLKYGLRSLCLPVWLPRYQRNLWDELLQAEQGACTYFSRSESRSQYVCLCDSTDKYS